MACPVSSWRLGTMLASELRRHAMTVVVGFDIHREQVTYDALDDATGEVMRGRIAPADRPAVHRGGAGRCRCDRASGRAGGDGESAGPQGAGEDRPYGRASPA